MTDITESEIKEIIQVASNNGFFGTESQIRLFEIEKQILQNQKEAQEYEPIKDFLKSNMFTITQIQEWLAELVHLREQHKKLVDAIQELFPNPEQMDAKDVWGVFNTKKFQNLLKESEKE